MAVILKTTSKKIFAVASVFQPNYFSTISTPIYNPITSQYYEKTHRPIQNYWPVTKLLICNNYNVSLINAHEKQTASSELKFPNKPKLPANPFIIFLKQESPNYPDMKSNDKVSYIAKKYRELSENEKDRYRQEFDKNLEIFRKNLAIYNENLTPEEKEHIIRSRKEKQIKKKILKSAKDARTELQSLGKPKAIGSSFSVFISDYSAKNGVPIGVSEATKKWKVLSEVDKAKYKNLFLERQEKYEKDLIAWEKKMSEIGRKDLVRVKSSKIQTKE